MNGVPVGIFADASGGIAYPPFLLLYLLLFAVVISVVAVLAVSGGLLAWMLAGRPIAIIPGCVAFLVGAWAGGNLISNIAFVGVVGYLAAVAVGLALRDWDNFSTDQDPFRRRRGLRDGLVLVVIFVICGIATLVP